MPTSFVQNWQVDRSELATQIRPTKHLDIAVSAARLASQAGCSALAGRCRCAPWGSRTWPTSKNRHLASTDTTFRSQTLGCRLAVILYLISPGGSRPPPPPPIPPRWGAPRGVRRAAAPSHWEGTGMGGGDPHWKLKEKRFHSEAHNRGLDINRGCMARREGPIRGPGLFPDTVLGPTPDPWMLMDTNL